MPNFGAAGQASTVYWIHLLEEYVIKDHHLVDVFIGIDVGKSNHHAVAVDRTGKKLLDKALPQDETKLRAIIASLARHGTLLLSPRVPGVRANVFQLTPAKDGLNCVESSSKGKPGAFSPGSAETQQAIDFLNSGDPIMFYDDLDSDRPASWDRAHSKYKTFMSLPIAAPIPGIVQRNVYGMLTVDAPRAKLFHQIDKDTAEIVADLLATAFAIVESTLSQSRSNT